MRQIARFANWIFKNNTVVAITQLVFGDNTQLYDHKYKFQFLHTFYDLIK